MTAIESEHTGIEMTVEDIPTNTEQGLKANEAKMTLRTVNGALAQVKFPVTGEGSPRVGTDFLFSADEFGGVVFGMAGIAHGCGFASIAVVHGDDVGIDFIGVAVEFPKAVDDTVHFDDVMAFEVEVGIARETGGGFVSSYPVVIRLGHSDTAFHALKNRICSHASTIPSIIGFSLTKHRIFAYKGFIGKFGVRSCLLWS